MSVPLLRSKITLVVLVLLVVWAGTLAAMATVRRYRSDAELQALETSITDTERDNARLTQEVQRMHQPQWLALLARQRLNYQLPDETVVFVYKSEKSDTISPPTQDVRLPAGQAGPHWQIWWDWLRGVRD
jgi:cell division protein FtsL